MPLGAASDDYGADFPDTGAWKKELSACSIQGKSPSRYITWFQAQQACAAASKRLCSNAEWQGAAVGTPDSASACNINSSSAKVAGAMTGCQSRWGAMDMVGNLWEWVAWWDQAGKRWMSSSGAEKTPWPTGYGDSKDKTMGVNGSAQGPSAYTDGLPGAALRGGSYGLTSEAGAYALDLHGAPSRVTAFNGFRCCLD